MFRSEKSENNALESTSFDHSNIIQNYWDSNESNDSAFYEPNEMGMIKIPSNPSSPKKFLHEIRQENLNGNKRLGSGLYETSRRSTSELTRNELENEIM